MLKLEFVLFLIFILVLISLLVLFKVSPLKREKTVGFTQNIAQKRREGITKKRLKRGEKSLMRLDAILKQVGNTLGQFYGMITASLLTGNLVGLMLFDDLLLAVLTGITFMPLPYFYITLKLQNIARQQTESLESAMAIITNAYMGCDDIVHAVELYSREKNRFVQEAYQKTTAFDEFVSEILLINPNIERGLLALSTKMGNRYFTEWIKMLVLCHHDRRLKFALYPVIKAMNDAKSMQLESDTQMLQVWREYFLTVALMFGIIPIMRFSNESWFVILTQTGIGKFMIALMLIMALGTSFFVMRITKPINAI